MNIREQARSLVYDRSYFAVDAVSVVVQFGVATELSFVLRMVPLPGFSSSIFRSMVYISSVISNALLG